MQLTQGAKFTGEVISLKPKRSALIQGGFEIQTAIVVECSDSRRLKIFKGIEEVSFFWRKIVNIYIKTQNLSWSKSKTQMLRFTPLVATMNHKYCTMHRKKGKILFYWSQEYLYWIQNSGLK